MNTIKPPFDEDYEKLYGTANYKNKTVLDIGADYGSTAHYFLEKGAKKIIAVEGDTKMFKQLLYNFGHDKRVVPIPLWIDKPLHFGWLIRIYIPDITKIDIEGYEIHLAGVEDSILQLCEEYIIETHTKQIETILKNKFTKNNYKTKRRLEWQPNITITHWTKQT